jgi:2',3'-cyclic-nucleotide 2'-phosphodiesterase (5'-nucleotidase family)
LAFLVEICRMMLRRFAPVILVLLLFVSACAETLTYVGGGHTRIEQGLPADSAAERLIQPYRTKIEKEMSEVLAFNDSLMKPGRPEGRLGNLLADVVYQRAFRFMLDSFGFPLHACLLNNGGIRAPLPAGNVTLGQVFSIMPFENEIVVLKLKGEQVSKMLDYIASRKGEPVSKMHLLLNKEGGWIEASLGGKPFDSRRSYFIATSDYLANGGDKMDFFRNPEAVFPLRLKIREVFADYLRSLGAAGQKIPQPQMGRIDYAQ